MNESFQGETILARWVVDAAALRRFVAKTRIQFKRSAYVPEDLLKECEKHAIGAGLEVVVREDAVFVGEWGSPNCLHGAEVHETWMRFMGEEGFHVPVPLAPGEREAAERIAGIYSSRYSQAVAEEHRRFHEERARPTWSIRLVIFAEAHFVWLALGFFLVLIPLFVLLPGLLLGGFSD
jgi:hypothetical protein